MDLRLSCLKSNRFYGQLQNAVSFCILFCMLNSFVGLLRLFAKAEYCATLYK